MRRLAAAALAAAALLRPASSECSKHIRFGTFDEANPYAALAPSQWLDDDEVCWVYYRQLSGGRAVAHLDSGELDVAMLGSTPYATAVARGAALTAVAVLHNKGTAQALVVRCALHGPQDLRGTTIATPRYSTTHYILLAALDEAGLDHVETAELPSAGAAAAADRVTVVTISPTEIEAAWSAGRIDGGAVWGNTLVNLTSADWGGSPPSGCQPEPAHEMITAEMLALWGYETLNVLAVRNAFLSRNEALVERLAAGIVRANADYRLASERGRWAAGPGGEYNSLVSAFVALEAPGYDSNVTLARVADRVAKFEYPTAEQQLEEQSYLAAQIEKQADFMFSQKVLASIPNASGTDVYATYFNASFLEAALAAGAASGFDSDGPRASPLAPLQQESVLTPCAGWAVEVVNASHAPVLAPHWPPPHAGGGGGAYRTDESCVWAVAVEEPTQCVELRLPFLSSEPPHDVLEVFSSSGLLISSFTGRASPPNATVRACANSTTLAGAAAVGTALTADRDLDVSLPEAGAFLAMFLRWSTDGHDEMQLGNYTAVGFRASVSLEGDASDCPSCGPHGVADSAGGSCGCRCDAGYAGSSCELETCNGVVTRSEAEGAVRATAVGRYDAYSRCGWLLTGGGAPFVALNLSSIRLELGFDEVRVYEGGVIPASFSAASTTSDDFLFSTFGSSPAATLAVRTPAFVAFTSDGVWSGSGFELAWSAQQAACETDADCSGRGSCRDGECRCDVGAYGPTCSFEKCVGLSTIEGAVAGMLQAIDDSQDDYLSSVACRWELAMPTTIESLDPPLSVTGLRLNFSLFELEEPQVTNPDLGIRSSTTDAVRVLDGNGTILDTFSSTSNANRPTMGEAIALDGPPPFTLRFDTDINNPRPYRGFRAFFLAATKEETLCHAEHFPCTDVEKPECRLFAGEAHGYCTAKSSPPTSALLPASLAATFAVLLLIGGLCCVVQRRRRRRLKGIIKEAEREFARWEPLPEEHRGATALRAQLTESILRVRSSLSFRGTDVGDSRPGSGNASPAARGVRSLPKRQRPRVVSAVGLPEERYHCFLSHVWSSGQDQARALKGQLQRYVQNIQPFLDVDNLDDTARLEEHVGNSEVVIVLLTGSTPARSCPSSPPGGARSDYFGVRTALRPPPPPSHAPQPSLPSSQSANCLRELHAAVARSKPLLLVLETDPTHGGVPLEVHRSACPAELRAKVFSAPLVTWHRLRPFQMCSMRLLIAELLRAWKAPGAERPIFLPGDLCRSPPPQLATKRTWHLCYSRDNEGAAELVARLERASEQQLRATADAEQMRSSAALLLYLDGATFGGAGLPDRSKDGAASEGLVRLVRRALDDGIPMVLVHEQRSVPEAVSFDEIIRRTPAELVSAGIYRPIATPLLDEPHAAVAVRLVLNNLDLICRRIERHNSGVIGSLTALAESLTRIDMDGDGEIGNSPTRSSEHAPGSAPKPRLKWRRRTPPEKVASCV